jgi:NADPH:quinone reductase-like Zn-dependent oxidoreductase
VLCGTNQNHKDMTSTMMQAAVLSRYGAPQNIEITTIKQPTPQANEVLVKVYATPVTTADTMMRRADPAISRLFLGFTRPRNNVMGTGFAGKVVGVGAGVEDFEVGDRVFGESGLGFAANAEYVCVPADGVIDWIPMALPYADAATLCDGPLTSYHFLKTLARVEAGQSVLIIGASGSLGTAAVQLVRAQGARVTGVCSTRNVELVRSLGADDVIDYTATDFNRTEHSFDVIYDTISNSSYQKCKHLLTETGIYMTPVLKFRVLVDMLRTRLFSSKSVKFDAAGMLPPSTLRGYLTEIIALITQGKLRTIIDQKYPLAEAASAHAYVDSGRKRGNVVLTVVDTYARNRTETLAKLS